MTRKDYIKIAEAIKPSVDRHKLLQSSDNAMIAIEAIAARIAAVCATDNDSFDPKRFFTACGLYTGN